MRDVIVIGGGCYGTFYARQLAKAKDKGRAAYHRVIVVDRDARCRAKAELGEALDRTFVTREWGAYLAEYLIGAERARRDEARDYVVPSPLMPHLMFEQLAARAPTRCPAPPRGARRL